MFSASGCVPIRDKRANSARYGANGHDCYLYNQGREGVSPWDNPEMYDFESALTHVPEVTAPFLIMHGGGAGSHCRTREPLTLTIQKMNRVMDEMEKLLDKKAGK
jgi:hypothetical protein